MMPTEFSGAPLVAGSVIGVRAFDVDGLSRLRGVTHTQVWTPGENVADCKIPVWSDEAIEDYERRDRSYELSSMGGIYRIARQSYRRESDPHDIGTCSCGFYAYYSGPNDYGTDDRIQAVIEGWGETAIGTRGFRCSKAKIVALCVKGAAEEPRAETAPPSRGGRLVAWLGRNVGLLGVAACLPGLALNAIQGNLVWSIVLASLAAFNLLMFRVAHNSRNKAADIAEVRALTEPTKSSPIDIAKIRRNYPDVPIFTDYERMLAEFPTSRGEEPSPETDPDFWTRSI